MMLPLGIETKIATIPNAIRPSSAQNSVRAHEREVSARGVAVGAEGGDERRGGAGRLPESGRVGVGVVGDDGGDREAEQEPEPEQQPDRELLAALGGGDVESEDARERADEQHQPGRAAEIAAEVGAERGEADGDGDEAHDLAEQRPARPSVVRPLSPAEGRAVVGDEVDVLQRHVAASMRVRLTELPRRGVDAVRPSRGCSLSRAPHRARVRSLVLRPLVANVHRPGP